MRARTLALLAAMALTGPAHATAAPPTPLHRAVTIADARWPDSPCHGHERLQLTATDDGSQAAGEDMYGFAVPDTCTVYLNWARVRPLSMRLKCRLLMHEFGHLAGREHREDPRSVMFPALLDLPSGSSVCGRAFHEDFYVWVSVG
jgi:hypothetical protein